VLAPQYATQIDLVRLRRSKLGAVVILDVAGLGGERGQGAAVGGLLG